MRGPLELVNVDGVPMLRAIGPGEFLIPLSQTLPSDFTIEFDFISRTGAGQEIAFEGGPVATRSVTSAEVLWNHQIATIMGGGVGMAQITLPSALQTQVAGKRTKVQVAMSGTQFKLFTNGLPLNNLPTLAFQRASELRIFLGGVSDGAQAVYLAGIRLATNGPPSGLSGAPSGGGVASSAPTSQSATGKPTTGGTIVTGGPTSKLPITVVQPPASIPTAPAARNQPIQTAPTETKQALSDQPPTATGDGALELAVTTWPSSGKGGIGAELWWTAVPGASSYRIYRTPIGSMLPGLEHLSVTDAAAGNVATELKGAAGAGYRALVDPFLEGAYIYWVDATFSNRTFSNLSPSFSFTPNPPPDMTSMFVQYVEAVAGQPTTVTNPWNATAPPSPGRYVTWTWPPLTNTVVYQVSLYAVIGINLGTNYLAYTYNETLLSSRPPTPELTPTPAVLAPLSNRGYRTGPSFTIGIPSGVTVRFCVSLLRMQGSLPPTPLSTCKEIVVP
jgi:hypothetical protein